MTLDSFGAPIGATIGIVGTGAMGRGIAEVTAKAGLRAILVKATPGTAEEAARSITASLERAVKKGKLTAEERDDALLRITFTSDFDELSRAQLVIESVVEELGEKRRIFSALETRVSSATVLASNTSALPLKEIASALKIPSRFLGLHFFSPVPAMKLVEVATLERTYPAAVELAQTFVRAIGKTPVMVSDSAGYIVNRLLVPYLLDGMSALEAGVAPAASIDSAMKLGCGHPMGPLELADAIGLDIVLAMAKSLHLELDDRRYSPPALLRRLVLNGHFGKKSGIGIYDYRSATNDDGPHENPDLWPTNDTTRIGA